jgi:hypothetical protein
MSGRSAVVAATLKPLPKKYGVIHWSTRLLARHLGVSDIAVARIWREHDLQSWRSESFRFSTDPDLETKIVDVLGLYQHRRPWAPDQPRGRGRSAVIRPHGR